MRPASVLIMLEKTAKTDAGARANLEALDDDKALGFTFEKRSVYKTGAEILSLVDAGERFFVGRRGGLCGDAFSSDVQSGRWAAQAYETNAEATSSPGANWFPAEDFVLAVKAG